MAAPQRTSQIVIDIAEKVAQIGLKMQNIDRIGKNGLRDGQIVSKILGGRLHLDKRSVVETAHMAQAATSMSTYSWQRRVNSNSVPDFYHQSEGIPGISQLKK
eukprot:g6011.t1